MSHVLLKLVNKISTIMSFKILIFLIFFVLKNTSADREPVFVNKTSLDFSTYLVSPHDVCNEISCISVSQLFFIQDESIICPKGRIKVAYADQAGRFRVASVNTNKARRAVKSTRLIENCDRLTPTTTRKIIKPKSIITSKPTTIQNPEISSILTEDDSFLACPFSLEDKEYIQRHFPANMFDDTGDAIYGSSLIALVISFVIAILKLKKNSKHETSTGVTYESAFTTVPKQSTLIATRHQKPIGFTTGTQQSTLTATGHQQPIGFTTGTQQSTLTATGHQQPIAFTTGHQQQTAFLTALQQLTTSSIGSREEQCQAGASTVTDLNEIQQYQEIAFCGCIKGNCIRGTCRCNRAKRACGPLCHKGKVNTNCKATLEHYT